MKNPIHPTFKTEAFPLILIALSIAVSAYFYSKFPQNVVTHWNFEGIADGYSSREFAAFFFPAFNLGIYILLLVLPCLDPKKKRYKEFEKTYHLFKNIIIGFVTLLYLLIGLNGMGYAVPVDIITPLIVGLLLIILGNFMGKIKSNWMMGIRTPWTLSNEEVWNKSHRFAGKMFILGGVLLIISVLLPASFKLAALLTSVGIAIIPPLIYSYLQYLKETKKK